MQPPPDRRSRRRPLIVEVQVRDRDEVYVHRARNVSMGGMFIDAPVPLSPGTRLQLQFRLPDSPSLACAAVVRWNTADITGGARARHPGMGVVFGELSDSVSRFLKDYMDRSG
jgi:uncharacterized protein (TIGR02266 family)